MTVAVSTPIVNYVYTGPGQYDFNFELRDEDDLVVTSIVDGVPSILTLNVDYTVTIDTFPDTVTGAPGHIDTVAPTASGGLLYLERVLPFTQERDWVNNEELDMSIIEAAFDKATILTQQNKAGIDGLSLSYSWRGAWLTGVLYEINDFVSAPDQSIYVCLVEHTSGVWATDLAASDWTIFIDITTLAINDVTSKPNLFINSAFVNNQRAYAGGVALSPATYGHDMMMAHDGLVTYTKETNGDITINTLQPGSTVPFGLWQKNDELIAASGKVLTVSVYVVTPGSGYDLWLYADGNPVKVLDTVGWHEYTYTADGTGTVSIGKPFESGSPFHVEFTFNSWKVEESPVRTAYLEPEPVAEANRCYNYCFILGPANWVPLVSAQSNNFTLTVPIPLRAKPDVSFTGVFTIQDAVDTFTITSLIAYKWAQNYVNLAAAGTGTVPNTAWPYVAGSSDATMIFDANYYS